MPSGTPKCLNNDTTRGQRLGALVMRDDHTALFPMADQCVTGRLDCGGAIVHDAPDVAQPHRVLVADFTAPCMSKATR